MRIAATYEDGQIFQHFGRTQTFKVYEVDNGQVIDCRLIETGGIGHSTLSMVLNQLRIETVICGGIGANAFKALKSFDITVYPGVEGNADDAIDALLEGKLNYRPELAGLEEEIELSCASGGSCASCSSHCGN